MPNHSAQQKEAKRVNAIGYEKRDASAKGIFMSVVGLFVVLIIVEIVGHSIIAAFRKSPRPSDRFTGSVRAAQAAAAQAPYPRLQISPPADLAKFREEEARRLNSYGWVDKSAGTVRIPVDRAMDLVLQKGLPSRKKGEPGKAGISNYELQLQPQDQQKSATGGTP
jgi:hypothetical protein